MNEQRALLLTDFESWDSLESKTFRPKQAKKINLCFRRTDCLKFQSHTTRIMYLTALNDPTNINYNQKLL